ARRSFPPIADYAVLSDGEVAALVEPSGNVEWLCLPQFDSPSVFGAILDRDAGRFRLGPADVQVPASRRYLPGSMVLETTWKSRTGWLVIRDALTVGPWHHVAERAHRQRRPPSDWEADHVLVRTARCAQGSVELHLECEPVFDYGAASAEWRYVGSTYHEAVASGGEGPFDLKLDTDLRVGFEGPRASARTTLHAGETSYVALSWSEHGGPESFHDAFQKMDNTSAYWRAELTQDGGKLRNMYGVGGERDLDERTIDTLSGYENSRPVRVGNAAYKYEQHDVWGALLDASYIHAKSRDKLPERIWPIVK